MKVSSCLGCLPRQGFGPLGDAKLARDTLQYCSQLVLNRLMPYATGIVCLTLPLALRAARQGLITVLQDTSF